MFYCLSWILIYVFRLNAEEIKFGNDHLKIFKEYINSLRKEVNLIQFLVFELNLLNKC